MDRKLTISEMRGRLSSTNIQFPCDPNLLLDSVALAVSQLSQWLDRTVIYGENQSAVLIGEAGCGKKHTVRALLSDPKWFRKVVVVFLDGSMLNTEMAAFQHVMRQLCPSGEFEAELKELGDVTKECSSRAPPFAPLYSFLKQVLLEKCLAGKSVFFVLDGFDFFVGNAKQLLLYNLMDWMQTDVVRIAVLGLTRSFNILQRLEKRVQSRFSNRQIIITHPTFENLIKVLEKLLSAGCIRLESSSLEILKHAWSLGKNDTISPDDLNGAINTVEPGFRLSLLKTISIREIVLLIGMLCCEALEQHYYTFEMIFEKYSAHCRSNGKTSALLLDRIDAFKSFENLRDLNLIETVGNAFRIGGSALKKKNLLPAEYEPVRMSIEPEIFLGAIRDGVVDCPTSLRQWALRTSLN